MRIKLAPLNVVVITLLLWPAASHAQQRRCPTCAPTPAPGASTRSPSRGISRRGAADATAVPMTNVTIVIAGKRYTGTVDAECGVDERATTSNTRAYYRAMYPWFGQKVAADKPQWRFTLELQRANTNDVHQHFNFSFLDGSKSATIQTVTYGERMGSGSVRVMRHGPGARFVVQGRSKEGEAINAIIDCSAFPASEAAGG